MDGRGISKSSIMAQIVIFWQELVLLAKKLKDSGGSWQDGTMAKFHSWNLHDKKRELTLRFILWHTQTCMPEYMHTLPPHTHTQRIGRAEEKGVLIGSCRPVAAHFRTKVLNKNTSVVDTVKWEVWCSKMQAGASYKQIKNLY